MLHRVHPLYQSGIILLHLGTAELDQGNLHQYPLTGSIAQLAGQIRENPDVAHQHRIVHPFGLLPQNRQLVAGHLQHILHLLSRLDQQKISQIPGKICHKLTEIPTFHHHLLQKGDTAIHILRHQAVQQTPEHLGVHRSQHAQHIVVGQSLAQIKGNALIQETQSITHGAIRGLGDIAQRPLLHVHLLLIHQLPKPGRDGIDGNPMEIVPLASGQNRDGDLVHLRGSQDENHIGRRLLQRLEQGVEGPDGEHVHLVDNVHLVFSFGGGVSHLLDNVPDIGDAVVGSGVNLYYIHGRALGDPAAGFTLSAGTAVHGMLAVDGSCKNFRHRRLSRSPGSGKKVGMSDPVRPDLIFQCGNNMILPLDILKLSGAEFSVKCRIGHLFTPSVSNRRS